VQTALPLLAYTLGSSGIAPTPVRPLAASVAPWPAAGRRFHLTARRRDIDRIPHHIATGMAAAYDLAAVALGPGTSVHQR
jgi:hypothetical protein